MVSLRPHILKWVKKTAPVKDPVTGYLKPATPGDEISVPCRWHATSEKQFRNEDNSTVAQKGRIRLDVGSEVPEVGQTVEVVGHFEGEVMEVYKGQLSWRIDV